MKALYITSVQRFSGKTAFCLAWGQRLQRAGYKVGYFKPVSTYPWEPLPGRVYDEDATFIRKILNVEDPLAAMVGVVLAPSLVEELRCGCVDRDLMPQILSAYQRIAAGKDIMLVEGGASLREGLSLEVDPVTVAKQLDLPVLAMVRYRNPVSMGDACVDAQRQFGERMIGLAINAVPEAELPGLHECFACMGRRGIPTLGVLPLREQLQAISVGEIAEVLEAEFLACPDKKHILVENIMVGAMSAEQALPRMRRIPGTKAVITGGDRTDIQLVAMETATQCLILTGYLRPVPEVLRRAEEIGVPVLLVRKNTMEAVDAIDAIFGKTRLGQKAKLEQFEALLEEHFDFKRLYASLGLDSTAEKSPLAR
ncbi:MAG TPA: phosphotransacetylase family protein [Anaerolineae bacterium]|nr:phosphotransacetylase family protein [Anaerolineae bacterium]HQH38777.1 phosphotransacetylase family protein [Anaerolineae bacterium]